jgi:A/G-specific adenine glycosylase
LVESDLIRTRILDYFRQSGRDLPWRRSKDPYGIWICEIMAQQTRIATVIPYWERWMARFPTPRALAQASLDDVLGAWSGLGYYARARSLHAAAHEMCERWGGRVPEEPGDILSLPGVGRYTAGAIASIAFGKRAPIVDGNVARVLARLFAITDDVRSTKVQKRLWELSTELVPENAPGDFNEGLMDLGATICTPRAPTCPVCPLRDMCEAHRTGRQEELPVKQRRLPTRVVRIKAGWIIKDGQWLLLRRKPRGLFGGLWELPDLGLLEEAGTRLAAESRSLVKHTHVLSHRTLRYEVYSTSLLPRAKLCLGATYDAARFIDPGTISSLGVSSATAALTASLVRIPWPTTSQPPPPPKRLSSRSARASRRSSRA